ncbi:MAG: ABC transporter, partial [Rhodospirillales bacterium]|nr:ABC transporter [Rhodospirillales bacterium]
LHDRLGTTLILVTHEVALADQCTRVLHLADGLIVQDQK